MTFSIAAIDKESQTLGVATATGTTNVGKRITHIKKDVAAIATQGLTDISYGIRGLKLLEEGHTPQETLEILLKSDPGREYHQVIIIDAHGRRTAFTGRNTLDYKGHILGEDYIVAGNLLANGKVIIEMSRAFKKRAKFIEKLLRALEAGKRAGGDVRGERSAALLVASKFRTNLTLMINNHNTPIRELRQRTRS